MPMSETLTGFAYLAAAVLFILALRGLSSPETARMGNKYGIAGMVIAVITTLLSPGIVSYWLIILGILIGGSIGTVIAMRIQMTALPQLVAAFHSLVGLAAVFVATAAFYNPEAYNIGVQGNIHAGSLIEMALGTAIGAITFSGSVIAFLKLQGLMSGNPITFPMQHQLNAVIGALIIGIIVVFCLSESAGAYWLLVFLAFAIGFLIIIPIGGADMPVVVSMLNSYSGWAACGIGFTLSNPALVIVGALVGSSGAILSYIMCKGMNRSIINVLLGGFGGEGALPAAGAGSAGKSVKAGSAEDAAFIMKNASKVIIVPGYGMAVAQAQHAVREMADKLKENGVEVKYAIHPVAGRMPGHMNVLLAEANVPYDEVFELEEINHEFSTADVAYVIGANDITNPSARTDKSSPIYGMPILDVDKAGTCLFVKRSMASGYAGVDNPLFFGDKTMMLFGDAKKMTEEIVQALG
jgi:NAD(P) transhydrogenase subunit beta